MADAPESQFKRVLVCPCWNIRLDVGPTVAVDDPPVFRVLSEACAAVLPSRRVHLVPLGLGGLGISQDLLTRTSTLHGPAPSFIQQHLQQEVKDGDSGDGGGVDDGSGSGRGSGVVASAAVNSSVQAASGTHSWTRVVCLNCKLCCVSIPSGTSQAFASHRMLVVSTEDAAARPEGYCPAFRVVLAVRDRVKAATLASGVGVDSKTPSQHDQRLRDMASMFLLTEERAMKARCDAYSRAQKAAYEALKAQTEHDLVAMRYRVQRLSTPHLSPLSVGTTSPRSIPASPRRNIGLGSGGYAGSSGAAPAAAMQSPHSQPQPQPHPQPPQPPARTDASDVDAQALPPPTSFTSSGSGSTSNSVRPPPHPPAPRTPASLAKPAAKPIVREPTAFALASRMRPNLSASRRRSASQSSDSERSDHDSDTGTRSGGSHVVIPRRSRWRGKTRRRGQADREWGSLPAIFSLDEELDPRLMRQWRNAGRGRTSDDSTQRSDHDSAVSSDSDGHLQSNERSDASGEASDDTDARDVQVCRPGLGAVGAGAGAAAAGGGSKVSMLSTSAPIAISRSFRFRGRMSAATVSVPDESAIPDDASPEQARSLAMSYREQAWALSRAGFTSELATIEASDSEDEASGAVAGSPPTPPGASSLLLGAEHMQAQRTAPLMPADDVDGDDMFAGAGSGLQLPSGGLAAELGSADNGGPCDPPAAAAPSGSQQQSDRQVDGSHATDGSAENVGAATATPQTTASED